MKLFNTILKKKKNKKVSSHAAINYKGKILNENLPFAVIESFKTLRTNLSYTMSSQKCPVFGIVSCYQSTGKSLISANLAVAFAMTDKKVLLIDGDMRKPVQHRCFSIRHHFGFSELLSGQCSIDEAIVTVKDHPNLSIILAGNIPPNPQELLAFEQTRELFNELKERFDIIIVDLPPVSVVADAMAISSNVSGYVFIVRAGESDAPTVNETIADMRQKQCNILGVVLNGYDIKTDSYYKDRKYGHYGKYSYYRRDSAEEKTE